MFKATMHSLKKEKKNSNNAKTVPIVVSEACLPLHESNTAHGL
jgi:hypothetical protein